MITDLSAKSCNAYIRPSTPGNAKPGAGSPICNVVPLMLVCLWLPPPAFTKSYYIILPARPWHTEIRCWCHEIQDPQKIERSLECFSADRPMTRREAPFFLLRPAR